ncbi:MAG: hypothetical protein SGI77_10230 [Pirellulaceae bacterium]|nr:hypothetical protein [Pirellulaceae bacterium]
MNRELELEQTASLSRRIVEASSRLFSGHAVAAKITFACHQYDQQCRDILLGRGLPILTIAVIGPKGQGKTWTARQFILDALTRDRLPSGVLAHEATTRLHWIGSIRPETMDGTHERYIECPSRLMIDLGTPYILLDTPGTTDSNPKAHEIANAALSLSPIQLLVIRRDQLRAATSSGLAQRSEGVLCIPVITAIPKNEWSEALAGTPSTRFEPMITSASLRSDLERWLDMIKASAPQSQILEPVLVDDFEASGNESASGELLRNQILARLRGQPLDDLALTTINRLMAASSRLKHQVHRFIQAEAPELSVAVIRLQEEANLLPRRAIESVLGSQIVLETAIRARLRTQMVADTSPLCFPYRTTLSLLSFSHGAWDRLVLAMTGSIPSIFGTFVAWARNVQQSRKIDWEMQQGLRDRLNGQVHDQLAPIQSQFHRALAKLRGDDTAENTRAVSQVVRLAGVDELQSRSRYHFERVLDQHRPSRFVLLLLATFGTLGFWGLMAGPILSIYRQFFAASWGALLDNSDFIGTFEHPSVSKLLALVVLSYIPMLLYAMIALTVLLRRSKIDLLAKTVQAEQSSLVNDLQRDGILRLEYEDSLLEQAQFLIALDRKGHTVADRKGHTVADRKGHTVADRKGHA